MILKKLTLILLIFPSLAYSATPEKLDQDNSAQPIILLKTPKPPESVDLANLSALSEGKLIVINRCLYIQSTLRGDPKKVRNTLTVWRWNDTWHKEDNKLKIVEAFQKNSATIGEFNRFGGGYITTNKEYLGACKVLGGHTFHVHSIVVKTPKTSWERFKEFIRNGR